MVTTAEQISIQSFEIIKDRLIEAPPDVVFDALLAEMGPESQMPGGEPMPMKVEPWPGGRWYRDLGDNAGHCWGHIQVIKPPKLLEVYGPLFMSYPVASHVQYRLVAEGSATRLKMTHRAMGLISLEHLDNVHKGWDYKMQRIFDLAGRMSKQG
ncbi:MAG: SRPBCC domain-containing protein [Burkholderiales bacterium]|nr:SRPBCC domain-containing protein [Phycisphaerae bacterium]